MIRIGVVEQGYGKTGHYTACLDAVRNGTPLAWDVLPWSAPEQARADVARCDALVLCGGDDVHARHFGQENHPQAVLDQEARDLYELALCRAAVEEGVPLLGICRGVQVLNVALGGDLHQHVPDLPDRVTHADGARHPLRVERDSILGGLLNGHGEAAVNSYHHQAVGIVADGLRAIAWSPDGTVEALQAAAGAARFCLGVQWHPERAGSVDAFSLGPFRALVDAAGSGR